MRAVDGWVLQSCPHERPREVRVVVPDNAPAEGYPASLSGFNHFQIREPIEDPYPHTAAKWKLGLAIILGPYTRASGAIPSAGTVRQFGTRCLVFTCEGPAKPWLCVSPSSSGPKRGRS